MTETGFYEPARLSMSPKPLFSRKPLDTTTWLGSLLSKVFLFPSISNGSPAEPKVAHKTVVEDYSLTLKMTTAQVVEKSVTVNNSHIQDYDHPDDYTQPTYEQINVSLCIVRL